MKKIIYGRMYDTATAELMRLRKEVNDAWADKKMWQSMYFDIAKKAEGKQE